MSETEPMVSISNVLLLWGNGRCILWDCEFIF